MSDVAIRLATYFVLLILLGGTAAGTALGIGHARLALHLGIALMMAALVFIVFMQLRVSPPLVRVMSCGAIVWLFILFGLTLLDYTHR